MRAIVIARPGGPDVLELRNVPEPEVPDNSILVSVEATALNRADLMQRRGLYPAPAGSPQDIPGLEYAGTVAAVGEKVTRWRPGDRVMGLVGGGACAEYIVTHEAEAMPIPAALSSEQAAAVPEAFLTAHDALFTLVDLQPNQHVLIHAVASGVGTAAAQLARAQGAVVYGTSRSPDKLARVGQYGVTHAIAATDDWAAEVLRLSDGAGVHGIVDLVGGDYLRGNVQVLASRGRLALVGLLAGRSAELDLNAVLRKRLHIIGTVMRARPLDEKIEVVRRFMEHGYAWLANGTVAPVIDRVMPMTDAAAAHAFMETNANTGKIVLRW